MTAFDELLEIVHGLMALRRQLAMLNGRLEKELAQLKTSNKELSAALEKIINVGENAIVMHPLAKAKNIAIAAIAKAKESLSP